MSAEHPFTRSEWLLGEAAMARLKKSRVALFGVGGVGGHCAEALARCGVGRFVLMDMDTVSLTNLNRQAVALHSTLGQPKADVMRARILDINPEAEVIALVSRYDPAAPPALWEEPLDLAIDAVDDVPAKVDIAWQAQVRGIPCISCMGAGNKLDPGRFEAADLYDTAVCPLCRSMRKRAREKGIERLRVIYSREEPIKTGQSAPGSLVYVTASAGLRLAADAVHMLLEP